MNQKDALMSAFIAKGDRSRGEIASFEAGLDAANKLAAERERELVRALWLARDFLYYSETPILWNRIDGLLKDRGQSNE